MAIPVAPCSRWKTGRKDTETAESPALSPDRCPETAPPAPEGAGFAMPAGSVKGTTRLCVLIHPILPGAVCNRNLPAK